MLLHGFGETGDIWKNQVALLEKNFLVIIPDLPGSGDSEMIEDMSMEGMAELVKFIIDSEFPGKEKFDQISLIGHSMGGYIGLAFADKYPQYLKSFGLFHSTAFADNEEKKANRKKGIATMKEKGAFEFLKTMLPNLFTEKTRNERPESVAELVEKGRHFKADALIAYYEAMIQRPDRTRFLKEASIPILFIMGQDDQVIPLQDGLQQCHFPNHSYIHILRESAHMGMLEEAEKSGELIQAFVFSCGL